MRFYFNTLLLRRASTLTHFYFDALLLWRAFTSMRFYFNVLLLRPAFTSTRFYFDALLLWRAFTLTRFYFDVLLLRRAFTSKWHYFDYYCLSNVVPRDDITLKTSKTLLELALAVRRHQRCLLTARANFWQSKMKGKQNKLGEGERY
jgi:hypothetical protein